MALSNLALFGGAFFTPVLVGKITHTLGWWWSFYFIAIFATAVLPLVIFFVPETAFRRASHLNTDFTGEESLQREPEMRRGPEFELSTHGTRGNGRSPGTSGNGSLDKEPADVDISTPRDPALLPKKVSYARSLLPFNGRKTDENFLKLLLRPFPLFLNPAILWACLIQGTMIGWTVFIGVVLAAIFLGPPLFFDEVKTGYMYTGAFVGAIVGFLVAGLLADWSTKVMIRRNKGVYEPEFRIVLVVAQLVFGCAGLYGFGITGNDVARYGWFWPDFFFGLVVMGMVLGAVASALYIVDAHRKSDRHLGFTHYRHAKSSLGEIAVEAFTCLMIFKNMFSFGLTWGAYGWLVAAGSLKTFYIIASIQIGVCLLSIPMCKSIPSTSVVL